MSREPGKPTTLIDLFVPGSNCWRVENATRSTVLVDADNYFKALKTVCSQARQSVFILGWDFDRRERLGRDESDPTLEAFIYDLLDEHSELHIYLLLWDFHFVYAAEREWFQSWKLRFNRHERLHVQFDGNHPTGGSQHQKLVVVDDHVAFCGGIDLSRWRWDTTEHRADERRRIDADGNSYPPFHDAMMLVEGEVAVALGELARDRWHRSGHPEEAVQVMPGHSGLWPDALAPLLENHPIAIARTFPLFEEQEEVREVEQLFVDSIAAAENYIYIENQYFTSTVISEALAERLREDDPPDVVLVLPHHTGGWLEQVTMDALRARRINVLREADHGKRLRVWFPFQVGLAADECISVHCKLMMADDRFVHIGSANTSDRSMGLDSECDVALATEQTTVLSGLLDTFLAEHLGCAPDQVRKARERSNRLADAVDELRREDGRSLRDLACEDSETLVELEGDADLVDPSEPVNPEYVVNRAFTEPDKNSGHRNLYLLIASVVLLLLLAAAWRWTPLSGWVDPERLADVLKWFEQPSLRALAVTVVLVVASLLMVPLSLLVVLNAILLGPWIGFGCAMLGALLSSILAFLLGDKMGGQAIERFSGSQIHRLSKKLSKRGIMAVAMLRLVPVAPFTIVNLVAGASHLKIGQFVLGSVIGLLPGIGALTFFSGTLYEAIIDPSPRTLGILGAVVLVVVAGTLFMRRLLKSS